LFNVTEDLKNSCILLKLKFMFFIILITGKLKVLGGNGLLH